MQHQLSRFDNSQTPMEWSRLTFKITRGACTSSRLRSRDTAMPSEILPKTLTAVRTKGIPVSGPPHAIWVSCIPPHLPSPRQRLGSRQAAICAPFASRFTINTLTLVSRSYTLAYASGRAKNTSRAAITSLQEQCRLKQAFWVGQTMVRGTMTASLVVCRLPQCLRPTLSSFGFFFGLRTGLFTTQTGSRVLGNYYDYQFRTSLGSQSRMDWDEGTGTRPDTW